MKIIIGMIFLILGIVFYIGISVNYEFNHFFAFVDAPTLIVVVLGVILSNIAFGRKGLFVKVIKAGFGSKGGLSKEDTNDALALLKAMRKGAYLAGFLVMVITLVLAFGSLTRYGFIDYILFQGVSISLLGIFYAIVMDKLLFNIAITRIAGLQCSDE